MMIRQSRADNVVAAANVKKLKQEKESKRSVMARTLSNFLKSTESSSIIARPPTTAPPLLSTSSFFYALFLNNSAPQPDIQIVTTAWVSPINIVGVAQTTLKPVSIEPAFFITFYVILGPQKCPSSSADLVKDLFTSSSYYVFVENEMDKMQLEWN